jgi:hypothetical protein
MNEKSSTLLLYGRVSARYPSAYMLNLYNESFHTHTHTLLSHMRSTFYV